MITLWLFSVAFFIKVKGRVCIFNNDLFQRSEVTGVKVLERCTVELDPDEELDFSFVLSKLLYSIYV